MQKNSMAFLSIFVNSWSTFNSMKLSIPNTQNFQFILEQRRVKWKTFRILKFHLLPRSAIDQLEANN